MGLNPLWFLHLPSFNIIDSSGLVTDIVPTPSGFTTNPCLPHWTLLVILQDRFQNLLLEQPPVTPSVASSTRIQQNIIWAILYISLYIIVTVHSTMWPWIRGVGRFYQSEDNRSPCYSSTFFLGHMRRYRIEGVKADLSRSFWWLTGGRGRHTVHKCVVFYRFLLF